MHLYLVRHAHAADGSEDAVRPLSRKGCDQIRSVGRLLRAAEAIQVHQIWHSPLVRARETAVRLRKRLHLDVPLHESDGLEPGADPERTLRQLRGELRPLMVVGHDPHLSQLATLLVTGRPEPLVFHLKKGSVVRLDRGPDVWTVRWLVSPEVA